jgi:hypothetical protein
MKDPGFNPLPVQRNKPVQERSKLGKVRALPTIIGTGAYKTFYGRKL